MKDVKNVHIESTEVATKKEDEIRVWKNVFCAWTGRMSISKQPSCLAHNMESNAILKISAALNSVKFW